MKGIKEEARQAARGVDKAVALERKVRARLENAKRHLVNEKVALAFRGFQVAAEASEGVDGFGRLVGSVELLGHGLAQAGMREYEGAWNHVAEFIKWFRPQHYDAKEDPLLVDLRSVGSTATLLVGQDVGAGGAGMELVETGALGWRRRAWARAGVVGSRGGRPDRASGSIGCGSSAAERARTRSRGPSEKVEVPLGAQRGRWWV